ncbi:MAG TPA: class I SAM-dependent methyltransferase [Allocoleopsis sp.]
MDKQALELLEKLRQQYESFPYYGNEPIEQSPQHEYLSLYHHNLITAYYHRYKKVINTDEKLILDAGCGSGYKSLMLALANPGAKIIGIDLSENSLQLAEQRLKYHGFTHAEFYQLSIEELPSLGLKFDYINCDEVLYLIPDTLAGLTAMKSVLKPEGIIRANLHSSMQRVFYFRMQEIAKMIGLFAQAPGAKETRLLTEMMESLKDDIFIKAQTWNIKEESQRTPGWMVLNHLMQGDKGHTIPEVFTLLNNAGLEFISMVNHRQWQLTNVFKNSQEIPEFLRLSILEMSEPEQLHLLELFHPVHRLLDFWCGLPPTEKPDFKLREWSLELWQNKQIHLHPQLKTPTLKARWIDSINHRQSLNLSQELTLVDGMVNIDIPMVDCLFSLWQNKQSIRELAEIWQQLEPMNLIDSMMILKETMIVLENWGYVLID